MRVSTFGFEKGEKGTYFTGYVPNADLSKIKHHVLGDLLLDDPRFISREQQKKIYAMLNDISIHTGHEVEFLKQHFKTDFLATHGGEWFSLSDCNMTTAKKLIEHILEFCFEWDIPLNAKTSDLTREVANYLYLCLKFRKCAICGKNGEIHHVDSVGMGRNRNEYDHTQSSLICLCREHHNETHQIGWLTFSNKYKAQGLKLNNQGIKDIRYGG